MKKEQVPGRHYEPNGKTTSQKPGEGAMSGSELGQSLRLIFVTLITQLCSITFAYSLSPLFGQVSFSPVTGQGSYVLNALIFLSLPILGTLVYMRLRKKKSAKLIYAIAETILIFLLSLLILSAQNTPFAFNLSIASLAAILSFLVMFKGSVISRAILGILVGSEAGSFLAVVFSPPTVYLIFLFFAIYDVIAVFRGPLKKVIEDPGFGMLNLEVAGITVGLGDQIFYSMVPATAFFLKGIFFALEAMFVVDVGVLLTLMLLRRRKALPGLTIPLLLSLLLFLLTL